MPTYSVLDSTGATVTLDVEERFDSRTPERSDNPKDTFRYVVIGTDDDIAALNGVEAAAPSTYGGLDLYSINGMEHAGPGIYYGVANYESDQNKPKTNETAFSFDTAGSSTKILQSISTSGSYAIGAATAPDFKGAINVTEDSVEGVEIKTRTFGFTATYYMPDASVTATYVGTLYAMTGTVCDAAFYGFDEGEVLLVGTSGTRRGRVPIDWELGFKFEAAKNQTSLTVGPINGINKKAWEYLWVRYQKTTVGAGADTHVAQQPLYAYVEKVYEETSFSALGIGTSFP